VNAAGWGEVGRGGIIVAAMTLLSVFSRATESASKGSSIGPSVMPYPAAVALYNRCLPW
jgi:hypothetical protein